MEKGVKGVRKKKVYLMSKISEYLLHIVLSLMKYDCIYGQEKSVHINTIPDHLLGC